MFDDRLRIIHDELGEVLFPSIKELWLYENKRRCRDWLVANKIPHPKTWIFYEKNEAIEFLKSSSYPLVYKSNVGASAKGIRIAKSFSDGLRIVSKKYDICHIES